MDDFEFEPTVDDLEGIEDDFDFDIEETDVWTDDEYETEGHVSLDDLRDRELDADEYYAAAGAGWDDVY